MKWRIEMVVLQYFGKVLIASGLMVGLMGGVAWSETETSEESKPAQKNILKETFSKLVGKKVEGQASQEDADNELKAKPHEVKKSAEPATQPSAKPPAKAGEKEEPQGVLSKIAESVTDAVKDTIKVLTSESKDARKPEQKAKDKTVKKEPKKPVKTSKVVKKSEPPAQAVKKEKPQGVLSKIAETVTDTVKDTIKILTPESKDAKQPEQKAKDKTVKKEPKKPVKTSKVVKKSEPPAQAVKKEKPQGVLSKIAETVTDTVKDTIKILTPESKDAKQPEQKAKGKTVKKEPKKPVKTSKAVKQPKPPAKVVKKEEPEKQGVLSKITESVTDALKDTLKVLTPESNDAKKSEDKVVAKIEKKKINPPNPDNEMLAKEGEKQPGAGKSNTLIDTFKKLAGGSGKAEEDKGSK